jgi:hypothetical protein
MTREEALQAIEAEFLSARHARAAEKEGMVRVCARRAAGMAIGCWLEEQRKPPRAGDAMSRLRDLAVAEEMPPPVRAAASRLTSRSTPGFSSPHAEDPLEDARIIVRYLLGSVPR